MMDVPAVYELALKIARDKGFPRSGFFYQPRPGYLTPNMRTKEFANYFFIIPQHADKFEESNDPEQFIKNYIEEHYARYGQSQA